MAPQLERAVTLALATTAIAVAARAVHQIVQGSQTPTGGLGSEPELVEDWEEIAPFATRVAGSEAAPISILVLVDLQCPVCRAFHEVLLKVASDRPRDVQVLYLHYPLSYHRYALPAARAAECARALGPDAFGRWIEAIYASQDSLGLKPWTKYATDADLPRPAAIEECANDTRRVPRIAAGQRFGKRIGLEGTPTVIVNGWRYFRTPTYDELLAAVDALVAGEAEDVTSGR